jgi:PD-(D/E)XK nuclease superfamily
MRRVRFDNWSGAITAMSENFISLIVGLLPAFKEMERRLDRDTGRIFNIFENLLSINEPFTSRILNFLLDPREAHGQGDLFVRAFIQRFVPEWQYSFGFSEVSKRQTTELIDVSISDGRYWLGVENKIFDAPEMKRQAGRYLDALRESSNGHDYRLVYLSPRGKAPSKESYSPQDAQKHDKKLIIGAWLKDNNSEEETNPIQSVQDWLDECQRSCRAGNVTWFVTQFSEYVFAVISGQKEADMADAAIIALAQKDEQNFEAAWRIGENFTAIKQAVLSAFLVSIEDRLKNWAQSNGEEWEVLANWTSGPWSKNPYNGYVPIILRNKTWPSFFGVGIWADANGPRYVGVGILAPTKENWIKKPIYVTRYGDHNNFISKADFDRITNAVGPGWGKEEGMWPAWQLIKDSDGTDISDWTTLVIVSKLRDRKNELEMVIANQMTSLVKILDDLKISAE